MLRDYSDITDRLGDPDWWDDHGAPRYCEFRPLRATIYKKYVAFAEVQCQGCDRTFLAASARPEGQLLLSEWKPTELPTASDIGSFHYGDPPRHDGCVGETMNIYTLRILEFWERDPTVLQLGADPWRRRPDLEFVYGPGVT
jgi:hypothetical protein